MTHEFAASKLRAQLNHPVVDSDGHFIESWPVFLDYLKTVGGPALAARYATSFAESHVTNATWNEMTPAQRRDVRIGRHSAWIFPAKNTVDLATAIFPKLFYERLDEIGLDFTVLYPGAALVSPTFDDEEMRRGSCRAYNNMFADLFSEFRDRMTPVAVIPMHTPQEAIEELEHVVNDLGLKVVTMASYVRRPIPAAVRRSPEAAADAYWLDCFGLDSDYDYDPLWAKCVELKISPTFHGVGLGWANRRSISNFTYNRMGHFAAAGEAVSKALFLGGVTRRFPTLTFAFMEGGVGLARMLYCDLVSHWAKRNPEALSNYDPSNISAEEFSALARRYGGRLEASGKAMAEMLVRPSSFADPEKDDDFAACGIRSPRDIRDLFIPRFYFGCEGDDPVTATAFRGEENPLGARLRAIYGSDLGHWDVPDMREALHEAHEPVEHRWMSEENFKDFVFINPVSLWTGTNPDFFKGTVVEAEVNSFLARSRHQDAS